MVFGLLYPGYMSYKVLKTKRSTNYVCIYLTLQNVNIVLVDSSNCLYNTICKLLYFLFNLM